MVSRMVSLIGCGTIGRELALAIDTGRVKNASLISLFDIVGHVAEKLKNNLQNSNPSYFSDFSQFISSSSFMEADIIIEAASQQAVRNFGKKIVECGKTLMVMSVGAFVDKLFLSEMVDIASKYHSRIYLPTGAIAGIDAIRSVKYLLDSVTLITTKSPKALDGAPFFNTTKIDMQAIKEKTVIYEGAAADAIKKFPANVNVAAVLSLAGIGNEKTIVKIVADPNTVVNEHEITAKGRFGEIKITVRNVPSPNNPKTSLLAVLSAIECLRSICSDDSLRIGS